MDGLQGSVILVLVIDRPVASVFAVLVCFVVFRTEALDLYADMRGRQRIETTPNDNCFSRAVATALQRDLRYKLDWGEVGELIRMELDYDKDHYTEFLPSDNKWSWADFMRNPFNAVVNIFSPGKREKCIELPEVWISAAANALRVQIVLVQLSDTQEPVERSFKPRLGADDDSVYNANVYISSVYIAHYCCEHHQFDALVKKSSSENIVSVKEVSISVKDAPVGIKK